MVNEVSVWRATGTACKVDMAPVHMIEDTYTKSPIIESVPTAPEDGTDPETGIEDTKQTLHRFVLTGVLTLNDGDATNGVTRLVQVGGLNDSVSKIGRLRLLYGYGSVESTKLTFNYNGVEYEGFMTRLTTTRAGGEDFYEYIIEILEGKYLEDTDWG